MRTITVERLSDEYYEKYGIDFNSSVFFHTYSVPSKVEALAYAKQTRDTQYDRVEGKVVDGSLPMVWEIVKS